MNFFNLLISPFFENNNKHHEFVLNNLKKIYNKLNNYYAIII